VIVVGKDGKVAYEEIVSEMAHEPDYDKALAAAKAAAAR
jgi:thiol peroxidase